MQDSLNKIKALFEKLSKKEPSYTRKNLHPTQDWMVIFISTVLVIIVCALGAFYFYKQVDAGNFFAIETENIENEVKININLLKSTVEDINTRQENFTKVGQGNNVPADPSR